MMRDAGFSAAGLTAALGLAAGQAMRMDTPNVLLLTASGLVEVGWFRRNADRNRALAALGKLLPRRAPETLSELGTPKTETLESLPRTGTVH